MARRFNRILYAIKQFQIPETNEVVQKFRAFRSGTGEYKVDQKTKKGSFIPATLKPFTYPSSSPPFLVSVTGRFDQQLSATGLSKGNANIKVGRDEITEGQRIKGFMPAKCVVFIPATTQPGATTNKTSQITGKPYKKRQGSSLTIPFGRDPQGTQRQSYYEMQAYLAGKLNKGVTASFKPEIPN
jgi:hypothetical protein